MKLLSVGFALCVAAAIAILFALRDDGQEVVADTPKRTEVVTAVTHDAAEAPATGTPAPRSATLRDRPLPARVTSTDTWASSVSSHDTQDAGVDDEPIPVDDQGLPQVSVTKPEVAEANAVIEPLVRECIAQSGYTGSGSAVLRLVIGRQREKETTTSVQETGFDADLTSIGDERLVDCLHKTATHMSFPKTQTGGALWATRMVVIENGQLTEHSVIDIGRVWSQYKN